MQVINILGEWLELESRKARVKPLGKAPAPDGRASRMHLAFSGERTEPIHFRLPFREENEAPANCKRRNFQNPSTPKWVLAIARDLVHDCSEVILADVSFDQGSMMSRALSRRRRLFQAESLFEILDHPDGRDLLSEEANSPNALFTVDAVARIEAFYDEYRFRRTAPPQAFLPTEEDVIVVPGILGVRLRCPQGDGGAIWINPDLDDNADVFARLELASSDSVKNAAMTDARTAGAVPLLYDILRLDLEFRGYRVLVFAYDWRKNLELAAQRLARSIEIVGSNGLRRLHIVAHSLGALVARRAFGILGGPKSNRFIESVILLGPPNFGMLSAAFALAGNIEDVTPLQLLGFSMPPQAKRVFRSFESFYQLLPTDVELMDYDVPIDQSRFQAGVNWRNEIDGSLCLDRTTVILGDRPTVAGARLVTGNLVPFSRTVKGDGVVRDQDALLKNVRSFRAADASHMSLPSNTAVLAAIRAIIQGKFPTVNNAVKRSDQAPTAELRWKTPLPLAPSPASLPPDDCEAPAEIADATAIRVIAPTPLCRRLRVFSFDPLLAARLDSANISEIIVSIPYDSDSDLKIGPVGDYLEVVDFDPASGCFYAPVDLTHPHVTARDGLPADESNPQFHQQMVYAVAMTTIVTFEKALGRKALWAPRLTPEEEVGGPETPDENQYLPRLRIYPHALREANAYYDPNRHAILFGYFSSREHPGGATLPGGTVFTCQSFDIIAHETTHALLHGLHRHFVDPSNPDQMAFHEAFADIVAIFQHFMHGDVVREQIARTRGDLRRQNLLGQLAQEFGFALGGHRGALRQYIGHINDRGEWELLNPNPERYQLEMEPHARGAILVAAVFQAYLKIYEYRVRDLYRLASGGSGVLPDGDIHPDLVNRLTAEAVKSAQHVLGMCIRALDYVPPVDITFGEYLRALITADYDLVRDDDLKYRVAVIDAFREWGLYPSDVNVLDESALRWRPPNLESAAAIRLLCRSLPHKNWNLRADRRTAFLQMQENKRACHHCLVGQATEPTANTLFASLGLAGMNDERRSIPRDQTGLPRFEVHSLRPCCRIGPDGQRRVDLVAEIIQHRAGYFDINMQQAVDDGRTPASFSMQREETGKTTNAPSPDFWFRGGSTLIIDPETGETSYIVSKRVTDDVRMQRQREFEQFGASPSLATTYLSSMRRNPFALIHFEE